jgi:ABC-type multidrug transport system ATPase subunit
LAGSDAEILDEPLPRGGLLTRIRRRGVFTDPPKPVLEVSDLVVSRGARTVIGGDDSGAASGFNLTLYEGEVLILQAPNGWGKTTLFASLVGFLTPHQGTIKIAGKQAEKLPPHRRRLNGLQAFPSDSFTFPNLSVQEVLALSRAQGEVGMLAHNKYRKCAHLSGGENRRLSLTRVNNFSLINIYDEPFSALDKNNIAAFMEAGVIRLPAATILLVPAFKSPISSYQP